MNFRVFIVGCKVNKTERFPWDLWKARRLHHRDKNASILEQKQSSEAEKADEKKRSKKRARGAVVVPRRPQHSHPQARLHLSGQTHGICESSPCRILVQHWALESMVASPDMRLQQKRLWSASAPKTAQDASDGQNLQDLDGLIKVGYANTDATPRDACGFYLNFLQTLDIRKSALSLNSCPSSTAHGWSWHCQLAGPRKKGNTPASAGICPGCRYLPNPGCTRELGHVGPGAEVPPAS